MKIYLIGYKCSGKTTIGSPLAEKLGMDFIDRDTHIEAKHNKSIPNLFKSDDELKFRQLEHNAFFELLKTENTLIAMV